MSILNSSIVPVGSTGGYDIDNSLRFNDDDSAYLSRTPSTAGNRKTWTWSGWVKRGNLGSQAALFSANDGTATDTTLAVLKFNVSNELTFDAATFNYLRTTRVFRDSSAWYHIVLAFDTTNATATDRVRMYVNGVEETAFGVRTNPTLNTDYSINSTWAHGVGVNQYTIQNKLDGYLAEVNFVDGQALTPADFGETDEDYGHWKPIEYTGTYGTNGFYLDFKNSGLIGLDNKDTVDIFGDSSGIALYRFEDNVNDASGNYNGTATNITYNTDGVYTKCGVLNGSSSYLDYSSTNIQNVFEGSTAAASVSIWFKPTTITSSTFSTLFAISTGAYSAGNDYWLIYYNSTGIYQDWRSNNSGDTYESTAQLTNTLSAGKWYNLVATFSSGVFNYYVDGTLIGSRTTTVRFSNLTECQSGRYSTSSAYANCSLDNIRFFNKALTASEAAEISNTNLGLDEAGGNDWTPNNLAATDQMLDSPTNNFCTLNPLENDSMTLSEGNLTAISPANAHNGVSCTIPVIGGKWYWEVRPGGTSDNHNFGMAKASFQFINQYTNDARNYSDLWAIQGTGHKSNGSGIVSYGSALATNDVLMLAFDLDNGKFWAGKNGTWHNSGNPAAGTNAAYTNVPTTEHMVAFYGNNTTGLTHTINFGQDSSFAGNKTAQGNADDNGYGDFYYTPPTGFLALCTQNLPEPTVVPSEHFDVRLRTGTGSEVTVSDLDFQPDLLWTKTRSNTVNHNFHSSLMSNDYSFLQTNSTSAENNSASTYYMTPTSTGYTVGTGDNINQNTYTFVDWLWKANGAGVSNTNGTITSTVSANADAGFSIVSYTGAGSAATIGHGLSQAPEMYIVKDRDTALTNWWTYHIGNTSAPETDALRLNGTNVTTDDSTLFNDTAPTALVFSVGSYSEVSGNTKKYIAYCFHSVEGYSKVGSYTGNGSADGTFVHTSFKPKYIMLKRTDSANNWVIRDTVRDTYNPNELTLKADESSSEVTKEDIDITSNGFKIRNSAGPYNASGGSYIYLAFAEVPFKYSTGV